MHADEFIALVTALAEVEGRAAAARRLALALGARELLVLSHDLEADVFLPVLGLRKTLPGGPQWRRFMAMLATPGTHLGEVPALGGDGTVTAVACVGERAALVLLGGRVADEDVRLLGSVLPLLAVTLGAQQAHAVAAGELESARYELRQSASLMKSLDEARMQVDRTLVELDAQARSLHEARLRAEDATLAKDRFMAMLGHELRNPIAPIVTALELLRHRGLWSPEHDIMQRQVAQLLRLVNDLLDISRITGGKLVLEREPVEVASVIDRALEMTAPLLDQRRHQVHIEVADSGLCLLGDVGRLAQVFSNLLTNAAKYSDPGTPITIVAQRDGDIARVAISDHGIGIDPGMLESVFELFEQQGRGIDRAQGGLGLGLAIVRNLVAEHGGSVRAQSDGVGRGSRFVVELPLASAGVGAAVEHRRATDAVATAEGRILLVDDNTDAASTLAMALRMVGFDVRTAGDGMTALRIAGEFQPDAAVLDIGLPVMDGYELARQLRECRGDAIRLVALTGYGQRSDRLRATQAGFEAHLVKPVDFVQVHRTLDSLLGIAAAPRRDAGDLR